MLKIAMGNSLHKIVGFCFLALYLLSAFVPATQSQQSGSSDRPPAQTSSPQPHEVKIEFNHRVRMRDGTELSADIYRPDAPGRFPVILSRT
ncbi:MAG TPA: hypothetical protein VMM84_10410, partial [Pyrinomonadaceae bacterium]|nr:hypothetical protein [Pyrinomonadaceae bacterium]